MAPRPTVYRGVSMRSRTEAKAAAAFDRAGLLWAYEPMCYANAHAQYLPDFTVADRVTICTYPDSYWPSQQTFWEIKWVADEARAAVPRMAVIWDGSVRVPLVSWVPDTRAAYVAMPAFSNMDDDPVGWVFEASVHHCRYHGVVLQARWLPLGCHACAIDMDDIVRRFGRSVLEASPRSEIEMAKDAIRRIVVALDRWGEAIRAKDFPDSISALLGEKVCAP